jgi:predicted dehydrogenase
MEIVGSKGTFKWDYTSGIVSWTGGDGKSQIVHRTPEGFERNDMFLGHMKAFLERLEGQRKEAASSLADGEGALRVALAPIFRLLKGVWSRPLLWIILIMLGTGELK